MNNSTDKPSASAENDEAVHGSFFLACPRCGELEQSHARLLAALKYLSNDGNGCFKDWEDGHGRNIQSRLERPIRIAEKLSASAAHQNPVAISDGEPNTL